MTIFISRMFRYFTLISILLILVGCIQPPAAIPNTSLNDPVLTVLEMPVQVLSVDGSATALNKDATVPIKINETITVDKLARGQVRFTDRVTIDLFRESGIKITNITPEPGDFLLIQLEHAKGHIRVQLSENANAKVRLITSIAQVTTLRAGTDFVICHNPVALSCIVALKGEVEVVGQGKVVTIKGGEATYVLKDQPPFSPICAKPDEVNAWIDGKIGPDEIEPISKLVASWPPEPCSVATQNAALPKSTDIPSGSDMVKVEAGQYTIGADYPGPNHVSKKNINLPEYWIDRYEVTNGQYEVFLNETGHAQPAVWPGEVNKPVAGVTWNDANAFCTWANKRLPSEAEWEAAARGPGADPPLYPWGNDTQAGGKIYEVPLNETYEVGSFDFNQSPVGVFDMAGNVWEWVGDPYASVAEYSKVLRGGRYGLIKDMAHREQTEPNNERFVAVAGFRCAADQVGGN